MACCTCRTATSAALQCDPIEKKPFFHAHPGALAFSFGMLGCDLHCSYCQNWVTSQALRDPHAVAQPKDALRRALVADASRLGARIVVSTYNEPLITSEWAVAIFKEARARGLMTAFVSNGNGTPRVLSYLRPWVDLYKVDLKSFDDRHYRQLGGRLEPILATIRALHEMGIWLEIVTLLIPGFNDSPDGARSPDELRGRRLTGHPVARDGVPPGLSHDAIRTTRRRRCSSPPQRSVSGTGLRYVYAGNAPGRVGDLENTRCHSCRALLVERDGYHVLQYRLTPAGGCPDCGTSIPGRWGPGFEGQISAAPFLPARLRRI